MVYKIMSTVEAHLDNDEIVSQTQTALQNNILRTSKFIPEKIRNRIVKSSLSVDKNSLRNNNVCRGDIYVETSDNLSLIEQRQLVNGMTRIGRQDVSPCMQPVIIRNAPDSIKDSVKADYHDFVKYDDSAFIGVNTTLEFPEQSVLKQTCKKADTIAKALNSGLNAFGLKTVYADMTACESISPLIRNCYILLQKTSKFNDNIFSYDNLRNKLSDGFMSPKIGAESVKDIKFLSVKDAPALIGSISLENAQMAGEQVCRQLNAASDKYETALTLAMINRNSLFVNGVGKEGEKAIVNACNKYQMPKPSNVCCMAFSSNIGRPPNGITSSTEQDLSLKWNTADALTMCITGNTEQVLSLCDSMNDIVDEMNELYGCDENSPVFIKSTFSPRMNIGDTSSRFMFLSYDKNKRLDKDKVTQDLKSVISEYRLFDSIVINNKFPEPLVGDLKMSKPMSHIFKVSNNKKPQRILSDVNLIAAEPENKHQIDF